MNIYTFTAVLKDEYSAYVRECEITTKASSYIEACAKIADTQGIEDYKLESLS